MCGSARKVYARVGYVLFSMVWILVSLIIMQYGAKYFILFSYFLGCDRNVDSREVCLAISAVYRISFSLAALHLVLFFLCLFKNELVAAINEGAWPLKFLAVLGTYLASFFIPNDFFLLFGKLATMTSFLFLVYEMIMLIHLAYTWNHSWVDNYDSSSDSSGQTYWSILLVAASAVCYLSGLGMLLWMMFSFTKWWQTLEILATLLGGVAYTAISMSRMVEGGSLLTCGLMFVFNSFLCCSVVLSIPADITPSLITFETAIGMGFLMLILFYVSSATVSSNPRGGKAGAGAAIANIGGKMMETQDEYEKVGTGNESAPEITQATALYHVFMLFAAMYYSMLLTNWGSPIIKGMTNVEFAAAGLGLGVKAAAQWIATGLFTWSLVAPYFCPDRDFS